jgi:hypothetical protein
MAKSPLSVHQIELNTIELAYMAGEMLMTAALDTVMQRDGVWGISSTWVTAVVMIATPTNAGLANHFYSILLGQRSRLHINGRKHQPSATLQRLRILWFVPLSTAGHCFW